jgi:hypothetical protein
LTQPEKRAFFIEIFKNIRKTKLTTQAKNDSQQFASRSILNVVSWPISNETAPINPDDFQLSRSDKTYQS